MYLSTKGSKFKVQCFGFLAIVMLTSCSQTTRINDRAFYNIDSLVSRQITVVSNRELTKTAEINGKKDETTFVPDSLQWNNELDIFRQIDQVNKASFRDAYVVSDTKDINSNLTVREIKSTQDIPVTLLKLYYLGTPVDLRRIEATLQEQNTLYVNKRIMILEFDDRQTLDRYSITGHQKMLMDDSVTFSIDGTIK
jgi:hypothetical protein